MIARDHDDRIHTGTLPIAAAQVQPHAKLIKRQSHGKAIGQRRMLGGASIRAGEQCVTGDDREQKDARNSNGERACRSETGTGWGCGAT